MKIFFFDRNLAFFQSFCIINLPKFVTLLLSWRVKSKKWQKAGEKLKKLNGGELFQ